MDKSRLGRRGLPAAPLSSEDAHMHVNPLLRTRFAFRVQLLDAVVRPACHACVFVVDLWMSITAPSPDKYRFLHTLKVSRKRTSFMATTITSPRRFKMLATTLALALIAATQAAGYREDIHPEFQSGLSINSVPATDRDHWMRLANSAIYYPPVSHPCPQAPFGTAIVNTTSNELICAIANRVGSTGDPTQHGEITAIQHCTNVLQKQGLSPQQILAAWKDFSLYTNAEPCTMCLSAIRWSGFKEVIYGTSVRTIAESKS